MGCSVVPVYWLVLDTDSCSSYIVGFVLPQGASVVLRERCLPAGDSLLLPATGPFFPLLP